MESLISGTFVGAGSFQCRHCGYMLTLAGTDTLSDCPDCEGHDFVRASLFSADGLARGRVGGAAATPAQGDMPGGPILASRGRGAAPSMSARHSSGGDEGAPQDAGRTSDTDTMKSGALGGSGGGALSRPEPIDSDEWLQDAHEQLHRPASTSPTKTTASSGRSRSRASGRVSVAASRPTCASTTRPSHAGTRWSCARPTACACSTIAASTACSSTGRESSGRCSRTAMRSSSAATGCASSASLLPSGRERTAREHPAQRERASSPRSRRVVSRLA